MSCLLKRTTGRPQCDREPDVLAGGVCCCGFAVSFATTQGVMRPEVLGSLS
jgi:hypothetical protein